MIQEVLQGFRDQKAFMYARTSLQSLPIAESLLTQEVFDEATDLYRRARRSGVTVRSSVDCLIAICALRNNLTLLHSDQDFDHLSHVCPLDVVRV